jgi:Flp pilus assembly protein TadD
LAGEGDALAGSGSHGDAVQRYRAATRLAVDDASLHYRLGRSLAALGRWPQARQALEAARDLDALRFRADSTILEVIRGVAELESPAGDVELVDLDRIIAGLPGAASIPGSDLLYEHVHLTFDGNYQIAVAVLPTILRGLDSDRRPVPDRAGSIQLSADRVRGLVNYTNRDRLAATRAMARLTSHAPFSVAWHGRFDDELSRLREVVSRADLDSEISWLRAAVAARPDDLLLLHRLASALAGVGRRHEAIHAYERLMDRYPFAPGWREELGRLLVAGGRIDEAIEHYRAALDVRPGDVSLRVALGEALQEAGHDDEALSAYRSALAIRNEQATAHLGAGVILLERGQLPEAERHFRSAADHLPQSPVPHLHLARSLARQGRHVEAEAAMRRALELAEALGAERLASQIRTRLDSTPPER